MSIASREQRTSSHSPTRQQQDAAHYAPPAGMKGAAPDAEQLAAELSSSPAELAGQVETSLKRVVQETAWTIKRRQQARAMGIDLASEEHELDKVKRACLGYLQGVGTLKNWLMHAQAALLDELQNAEKREAEEAKRRPSDPATGAKTESKTAAQDAKRPSETIDLTMDVDEAKPPEQQQQQPDTTDAASTQAVPSGMDANAIIQQYIQQMPDQSAAAAAAAAPSGLEMSDFDLGSFATNDAAPGGGGGFDANAFDDIANFDFGDGGAGGSSELGLGGDLSSLDFTMAGTSNDNEFDFDTMMRNQHQGS